MSHGITETTMTHRRKLRSRSWNNRNNHDLKEKSVNLVKRKIKIIWPEMIAYTYKNLQFGITFPVFPI